MKAARSVRWIAAWLLATGCAGSLAQRSPAGWSGTGAPGEAGWRALVDGHLAEAERLFAAERARAPGEVWVALGAATIAVERGQDAPALAAYVDALEVLATGQGGASGALVAALAAARAADLLDEIPPGDAAVGRAEQRLLALPRERLGWEARVELARLGDRIARRRGDSALLERLAREAGCARGVVRWMRDPARR